MSSDATLPYRFAPTDRTIPTMLRVQADRLGSRPLFTCRDQHWTYTDAPDIAARTAASLIGAGVRSSDRVAILSRNRPEVMCILLGAAWCGAIAVPINAEARAPQVRHVLADCGARLLVAETDLLQALPADAFDGLAVQRLWTLGGAVAHPALPSNSFAPGAQPAPPAIVEPDTPFAILYTSGTTGPSKGVICPHAQFYWWAVHTCRFLDVREGDVLVTALPLFHTNAINTFFQALLSGARQVVEPRFSVSGFWEAMRRTDATVSYLLGAMVPMLLSRAPSSEERDHRIRTILAPGVPPALHTAFRARTGIDLVDGYGSTETNFVIGATAGARVDGEIGRLSPGVRARIVDADERDVAAGEAGELLLRTAEPHAFSIGYFGLPEKTAEAWRGGWFHTGDRVRQTADGAFAFVDRLKDSIRRRGENISSFEVEAALQCHPDVEAAAVYGVASDLAEEEVMATVVSKAGRTLAPAELHAHCATLLPRYALPRYIDVVAQLPLTENGKVTKAPLKARGVTATTWDALAGRSGRS